MSSDLIFKVSAELGEVKAALANLRTEIQNAGKGSGASFAPLNDQLDRVVKKEREAATEAEATATAQERAARKAADAKAREAARAAAAERRAAAEKQRDEKKAAQDRERQARREQELQRRAAESAQRQATAQQRALAPQLTDIGVGLATGQSPLMVLLQQGGQLKDLFGGIVPAAKAVGGAVLGLITPFTALAGALAVVAIGYVKGSDEAARFRRILVETGNASGQTAEGLQAQARAIAQLSGGSISGAADTLAEVAASGKFAGEQIAIVARTAELLRVKAGRDVGETVAAFSALADDPVKGADELNRKINFLTGSLAQQIRTLRDQGRTQEASTLAMKAYEATVAERTPQIEKNLGLLEKAWKKIKAGTAAAADAITGIGRADDQADFDRLIKRRQELEARLANGSNAGRRSGTTRAELEDVKRQIEARSEARVAAEKQAGKDAARKRAVSAQEQLVEEARQFETSQERLNREKTQVINRATSALADAQVAADATAQQEIERARDARLAAIAREQARVPAAIASANAGLVRDDVDRTIGELQRLFDRGLISAEAYYTKRRDLQLKATDAEIAATRAELATTQEPAELARLGAQIRTLERKKADIRRDAIREQATATRQLEESLLETEVSLNRDGLTRALDTLQTYFDQAGISTRDFYAARLELQEAAIDEELRLVQKRLASEDLSPADRAKLLAQVQTLERERSQAQLAAIRDGAKSAKDLRLQLDGLRAQELEGRGQTAEAAKIRLEAQFAELIKRLQAEGDTAGVDLVRRLINTEASRAQFDELQTQFDRVVARLRQRQQSIADQQATGSLDSSTASQQQAEARQQAERDLEALNAKLQELAATTNDPRIVEGANNAAAALRQLKIDGAEGLDSAIISLRSSLAQMDRDLVKSATSAGVDALANFFLSLGDSSKSAGEKIRDFVRGFAASMAQIAARALATYAVLSLLEAIFPGAGRMVAAAGGASAPVKHGGGMVSGRGGRHRRVDPMVFAGAPRYHSGGMVGLAPDEVPAILQTGEEVLSRNDPRNRANGGGQQGGPGNGYRIVNVVDPSVTQDFLESAAGERVILNVIGRNPGRIQQMIGR